jgi:hypothetical protein
MFGWPVNCWKKTRPTPIKSLKYKSLKFVEIKKQLSLQFYEAVNFLLGCLILTVISKANDLITKGIVSLVVNMPLNNLISDIEYLLLLIIKCI